MCRISVSLVRDQCVELPPARKMKEIKASSSGLLRDLRELACLLPDKPENIWVVLTKRVGATRVRKPFKIQTGAFHE